MRLAEALLGLKNRLFSLGRRLGRVLLILGRFTAWPLVLFVYKNILLTKLRLKNFRFLPFKHLLVLGKYLPVLIILTMISVATAHNILAQNYNAEEYVNRTLLPNLLTSNEEAWNTIVEENAPAQMPGLASNYLEAQGSLQENVVATPFAEEVNAGYGDVTPDSSSLVLNTPESAEETVAPTRTETIVYTVQAGDVLGAIAERFDITVNTVLWANGLNWQSTIRPGQQLKILPGSGLNYEVKKGDVLTSIAKKYQADVEKIITANELASASDINAGDLLFIPDGIKPAEVVSSYRPPKRDTPVPSKKAADIGAKLLWPLDSTRLTQYFSWRHSGVDVGDKSGNSIYAAEAGKVVRAGWTRGYGYNVVINHGDGLETLYGHASKLLVAEGDVVSRGQVIALIGSTGWSTGPHLHFEVKINGSKANPLNYVK